MSEKVLTVIVPSYNMEKYLPKCLGSLIVAPEWMEKLEVLVVNDGSKDRTSEIAHEFAAKWPRTFKVIDKENGHYGSCVNAALPVATGVYVKILDADDRFVTANIAPMLEFLEKEFTKGKYAADLVLSDYALVRDAGPIPRSYAWCGCDDFNISRLDYSSGHDVWMHAVTYRRGLFENFQYKQIEGITHTDIQWIHTPMAYVENVAYCPVTLYEYDDMREGNTSSADAFYRTFLDIISVIKRLLVEYPELVRGRTLSQKAYIWNHLKYRVRRVYDVYVLERSSCLKAGGLEDFDSFLREKAPQFYEAVADSSFGGRFQIRYVREWRRARRTSWWLLFYLKLNALYAALRRRIK